MLRIYFLQQWYYLSDPGAEEALYDMHSMGVVARIGCQVLTQAFATTTDMLNAA